MRYRMATYWVDGTTCAALEHRMYINLRLKNLSTTYPVRYLVFTKFSKSAVEQYDIRVPEPDRHRHHEQRRERHQLGLERARGP